MADDEELEAFYREITRGFEPKPSREEDPDYREYEEGLAEWWRAHKFPPTLILRCGIDGCRNKIGEVKNDGNVAIVLMYSNFGKRTVPFERPDAMTEESLGFQPGTVFRDASGKTLAEQQRQKQEDLDAETLDYYDDGRRLAKRNSAKRTLMSVDQITVVVCSDRRHHIQALPDPAATVADIRERLASATHASKVDYPMFGGNTVR